MASPAEIVIIDNDFDNAASYYASTPFGGKKEDLVVSLKKDYEYDHLNPLVYLFAKQRTQYTGSIANPAHVIDNKLVHEIVTWLVSVGPKTPRRLFAHMRFAEIPIPQWMTDLFAGKDEGDIPSQQVIYELLHQAIATSALET